MKKPISIEIKYLSNLIMRYIKNSVHSKKINDITGPNAWIIGFIAENKNSNITQKDLEDQFGITRSAVSKIVHLMMKKGLIYYQNIEKDARLKKLCLTSKALEVYKLMKEEGNNMESKLLNGFSNKEIDSLHKYLYRMQNNIKL